jgi:hypothetical protein
MRRDGAPWSHHYRNMRPTTERKRMQTPRKTTIVWPQPPEGNSRAFVRTVLKADGRCRRDKAPRR